MNSIEQYQNHLKQQGEATVDLAWRSREALPGDRTKLLC